MNRWGTFLRIETAKDIKKKDRKRNSDDNHKHYFVDENTDTEAKYLAVIYTIQV